MVVRQLLPKARRWLRQFPAVGLLGPRQCGKSTLAQALLGEVTDSVYLDLERPSDLARLRDPEAWLAAHAGRLVCLDEIHRAPELFPVLRSMLDAGGRPGQVLLLGSASPELLRQTSETLAGRIGYLELTPFLLTEVPGRTGAGTMRRHWERGGFPRSFLAADDQESGDWRESFVQTFLERDLPQMGVGIPAGVARRFWQMCAHLHGDLWNGSKVAGSLGVTHPTARSYLDRLAQTYMLRMLPPWAANAKKRLVKTPKVYVRDSGLLHSLLGIGSHTDLLGHPAHGGSWEGYVLEQVAGVRPAGWDLAFYRTSAGAECDIVLHKGRRRLAIECKASAAPQVTRGFWESLKDLRPEQAWVAAPVSEAYPLGEGVNVAPLPEILAAVAALA
ncbi:MAG: ATP-binding protein [Opitutus sp.]|nr:ATP-binding protein [Opitutus sp.]